jgi:iron(III) transport system substrate-binding protein
MSNADDGTPRTAVGKAVATRRRTLQAGLAMAGLPLAGLMAGRARAQDRKVTKVLDFNTSADVAKAEQEGSLLFYTHDGEAGAAAAMDAFNKDFPKIKAAYVRAQTGALYSKILAERSAGRFDVDVIQYSDVGTAIDFQKRGGYQRYASPESAAYNPTDLGDGYYFCSGMTFAGIAYNTDKVKPADAPKAWKDLLDPRWANVTSTKQSTSGMQFVAWYELRKLYGDTYWKAFAKQRPHGFDSRAQLFDRLAKGDDKVCALAEWAGYVLYHDRKAPIAFVAPEDGLPATALATGVVDKAPHPEAARLFIDWLMSLRGQAVYQENPDLLYGSVRKDAPPMPGGLRLRDFKLLIPTDMPDYLASRKTFNNDWNAMLGL